MKYFALVLLTLFLPYKISASDFDDIRKELSGMYIEIKDGNETNRGLKFTDDKFILGPLADILNEKIDPRLINGYIIAKLETSEFYIIPKRSGLNKYDDGFRLKIEPDQILWFLGDGKEGDEGLKFLKFKRLHDKR